LRLNPDFPYLLLDEGWSYRPVYDPTNLSNADILRTRPNLDMPALVNYARARVSDCCCGSSGTCSTETPRSLRPLCSWASKGVKIDFMARNDQDMVDFYHRGDGGGRPGRLLIDMHSAYPPWG